MMILEKIKNIFKPKSVTVYEMPEWKTLHQENKEVQGEIYHDTHCHRYRVAYDQKQYGSFKTKEEAEEARIRLNKSNFDHRSIYDMDFEHVDYDPIRKTYTIYTIVDGVKYVFGEFKRGPTAKKKMDELAGVGWPLGEAEPVVVRSPYYREHYPQGSYYYNQQYDYFYLPNRRGNNIKITAWEVFTIIHSVEEGYNLEQVYDVVDWTYDVSYNTVACWYDRFSHGRMDLALNFIIENNIVSEEVWRR